MGTITNVSPSATITTDGGEEINLQVIEATVETSRYKEAATIEMEGLAENATPDEIWDVEVTQSSIQFHVNGTLVGSGALHKLTVDGSGVVSVGAHDAIRPLKATTLGAEYHSHPSVSIITDALQAAGLEAVSQGGGEGGQPGYAIDVGLETDPDTGGENEQFFTEKNFQETDCLEAIDIVTRERGWVWYVDEENVFRVVDVLEPTQHDISHITETTAGLQSPPYKRVVVTGGNGASIEDADDEGAAETHLLSKTRVQGLAWTEDAEPDDATYRYEDSSLHTPEEAQRVAEQILEEFQRQRATGEITLVGDPAIRPLDTITMPESMSGEEYMVSEITHKVSNSDGYLTTIGVGGLVDEVLSQGTTTTGPDSGTAAPPDDDEEDGEETDDGEEEETEDDDAIPDDGDSGTAG